MAEKNSFVTEEMNYGIFIQLTQIFIKKHKFKV